MKIAVVGAGVVGKATGVGLAAKGHDVVFHDIDPAKLRILSEEGYRVAFSLREAIEEGEVTMICAPTPTVYGQVDTKVLLAISAQVGTVVRTLKSYRLFVVRSTIPPGTTRKVVVPVIQDTAGSRLGVKFGVCHNPEFLREKFALDDFVNPQAIIIGEMDKNSGDKLEEVYSSFQSKMVRCDPETSEMIKYVANLFNATKISFFNEIDRVCRAMGVQSENVSRLMPVLALGLREDLQEWGIYGGRPFAGMCLPKDLDGFISFAKSKGLEVPLLSAAKLVNQTMSKAEPTISVRTRNG